jgi:hypothetical protein
MYPVAHERSNPCASTEHNQGSVAVVVGEDLRGLTSDGAALDAVQGIAGAVRYECASCAHAQHAMRFTCGLFVLLKRGDAKNRAHQTSIETAILR